MKRTAIAAAAAVLLLALTGCAGGSDAADERTPAAGASEAPLVADTPQAEATPASPDETFLVRVRAELPEDTVIPDATDAQLIAAGQEACAQIAAGTDVLAVQVIEGEEPNDLGYYESSAKISAIASEVYCPLD